MRYLPFLAVIAFSLTLLVADSKVGLAGSPDTTMLASVDTDEVHMVCDGIGCSNRPMISPDGNRVAFHSYADDGSPECEDDGFNTQHVYVRDLNSNVTTCIGYPVGFTDTLSFGGDRLGTFVPLPAVPVPQDRYVYDISQGGYIALNLGTDQNVQDVQVSGDGKFVQYLRPEEGEIYRQEINTGDIESAPIDIFLTPDIVRVSSDGRFALIPTSETGTDGQGHQQLRLFDWDSHTLEKVSVSDGGGEVLGNVYAGDVSADGRFVAFVTNAQGVADGDTDDFFDLFVLDRSTQEVILVAPKPNATEVSQVMSPRMTPGGKFVVFEAIHQLVPEDDNGWTDVYIADLTTGRVALASTSSNGELGNNYSTDASISADGDSVAFASTASNLSEQDPDLASDIYVRSFHDSDGDGIRDVFDTCPDLASSGGIDSDDDGLGNGCDNCPDDANSGQADLDQDDAGDACDADDDADSLLDEADNCPRSANANQADDDNDTVGQTCDNCPAVGNTAQNDSDFDGAGDACTVPASIERVSVHGDRGDAHGFSDRPRISADGRYVAFDSTAPDLAPGDEVSCDASYYGVASCLDLFLHDRETDTTTLLRVAPGQQQPNNHVTLDDMTPDARFFVFRSAATNLGGDVSAAGVFYPGRTYLYDRETSGTELLDPGSDGGGFPYGTPAVSDDGRYVVLPSARLLDPADTDNASDVYLLDRDADSVTLLSVTSGGNQVTTGAHTPSISADGATVVFAIDALAEFGFDEETNLPGILLYSSASGAIAALPLPDGAPGMHSTHDPSVSPDGRYVVFTGEMKDFKEWPARVIWLYDLQTQTLEAISRNTLGQIGDTGTFSNRAEISPPVMSGDGRFVSYFTSGNGLTQEEDVCNDLYTYDVQTGVTRRLTPQGTMGNLAQYTSPAINANGSAIAFAATARNLVPNDRNGMTDVFVVEPGSGPPAPLQGPPAAPGRCGPLAGDFDCSGAITGKDVLSMLLQTSGDPQPTECAFMTSVACFGERSAEMAVFMLRHLAGFVEDLDCHAK